MLHGYYGRRRRGGRGVLVLLLFLTAILLVSCVAGSNVLWVKGLFGLDIADYTAEPAEREHTTDGSVAQTLCEGVSVLVGDSLQLRTFGGSSQAVQLYRDEILDFMMRKSYALYNGNSELIASAQEAYPHAVLTTVIPQKDFESTVYRYFGGNTVEHKSGNLYSYLKHADCYTTVGCVRESRVEIIPLVIEESANTYRMEFCLSNGQEESQIYRAVFVKRQEGAPYLKALQTV